MKLNQSFDELGLLVQRMGASPSTWSGRLEDRLLSGIEVDIGDIVPGADRLLTYKGRQVLLYIKDTRVDRHTLRYNLPGAPRFHVAECNTIELMRQQDRFERYVATTNRSGRFAVEAARSGGGVEELEAELSVCKNCLAKIDWRGYRWRASSEKSDLWRSFFLDDLFAEYATFFSQLPEYTDITAPTGGYPVGWSKLSEDRRKEEDWTCEECNVRLASHRHLLHCHHRNRDVRDCRKENLRVLCVICHSMQPGHGRMRPNEEDRRIIEMLRSEQGAGVDRDDELAAS